MKISIGAGVAAALAAAAFPATAEFAFSGSDFDGAEQLLLNGTTAISTNRFQGWVAPAIPGNLTNIGGPLDNENYIVEDDSDGRYNNYFVFDISQLTGPVTSAALQLSAYDLSFSPVYHLYDATALIPQLFGALSPDAALYHALGSGTALGVFTLHGSQSEHYLTLGLTAAGVADLNSHIANGDRQFAIGGSLAPVPEPAAWALMLAGFGGLGLVLRRRRLAALA